MLSRSPKVYTHCAHEPPRPKPPGVDEADVPYKAVNGQSGSEWCGQHWGAGEPRGASYVLKESALLPAYLGKVEEIDQLTADLGRPQDRGKDYRLRFCTFSLPNTSYLNGN